MFQRYLVVIACIIPSDGVLDEIAKYRFLSVTRGFPINTPKGLEQAVALPSIREIHGDSRQPIPQKDQRARAEG